MVVEYIRYRIDAGRGDEFERAYTEAAESLEASSHCLAYEVARGVEDANSYVVRIEWDSVEGHEQGFRKSPEFRDFFAAVRPFFDDIEEMRHYESLVGGGEPSAPSSGP
jgi:quinol monooxygenase YgiN